MKLYLVRHGQSEYNLSKNFSGWAQISLTEKGIEDARRAGEYLQKISFDRIYSSDLKRAIQTAQTALPGCEPIQTPLLRENNVGSLMHKPVAEMEALYGPRFWVVPTGSDFTVFGGEDHDMVRARVRAFLDLLEADPCERVVAFAHEGILRCMMDLVFGPEFQRHHLRCPNVTIGVFSFDNGQWFMEGWNVGA